MLLKFFMEYYYLQFFRQLTLMLSYSLTASLLAASVDLIVSFNPSTF